MPTTLSKTGRKSADASPMISEILELCEDVSVNMRRSVAGALKVGIRLLYLHRQTGALANAPGGFRAALEAIEDSVPRSTAYRWINAATAVLVTHLEIEPDDIKLPEPGTPAWSKLEMVLEKKAQGMSLRRLLIGSSDVSEESRFDTLITADEAGNKDATAILEQVAAGKFTLVQAIRALGGATTKEKHRTDPVYLDLDGATGQPTGLFPKCLVTLANTFSRWDQLSEPARREVKASWKEVVSKLPKELR